MATLIIVIAVIVGLCMIVRISRRSSEREEIHWMEKQNPDQEDVIKESQNEPEEYETELPTDVTDADVAHEIERLQRQRQEARLEWEERMEAAAQEKRKREAEHHEAEQKIADSGLPKPWIFFVPIMFAVAAVFDMPSGYYTFFKVLVLIEAVMLIGLRLSEKKFRSTGAAIGTVYMSVMALLGIVSFMTHDGFDKTMWVILDIVYCIMHAWLYFGLLKQN